MSHMGQNQRLHYALLRSPGGGTGDNIAVYDYRLVYFLILFR